MPLQPKPEVNQIEKTAHGGINYAEIKAAGLSPDEVLDFSVSANPFMPPPGIKESLGAIAIEQYPDSEAIELRERLSQKLGISPDNILAGSGTTELIRLIALAYFGKGESVLILEPTFGDYEIACRIVGASVVKQWSDEKDSFAPDTEETIALIGKRHPGGIFICNPNNPTGNYLSRREIQRVLDVLDDSLLILDEAYIAFVDESWNSIDLVERGNIIVLRSMTKDYGLSGLRLGYAIARREIIDSLRCMLPPWNVNIVAQKVGVAVLEHEAYLEEPKRKVKEARQFLMNELTGLGYKVMPSDANYFLVKVGNASEFRAVLLKRGILVRDCASFGLSEYVRIAPRTVPECEKLISAVRGIRHAK